jgi:hypothetical protein
MEGDLNMTKYSVNNERHTAWKSKFCHVLAAWAKKFHGGCDVSNPGTVSNLGLAEGRVCFFSGLTGEVARSCDVSVFICDAFA